MLQRILALAERQIAERRQRPVRQEYSIAELVRGGYDTVNAQKVFLTMQETQGLLLQDRASFLKERN